VVTSDLPVQGQREIANDRGIDGKEDL